ESVRQSLKSITYTINGLLQYIICYCIPAQIISNQADEVATSAYFSKWYERPTKLAKTAVLMIIANGQIPATIIACGFMKINMESCL
ncbi:hypothetical protein NQ318_003700, partial [Aromia moschata]